MSDLFHESLSDEDIDRVFAVMALAPQHTFQVLTKRAKRMREWMTRIRRNIPVYNAASEMIGGDWSRMPVDMAHTRSSGGSWWPLANVWLGVSAENQDRADERIPDLLATPAAVRFVSAEPLLGPINLRQILVPGNHFASVWNVLEGTHGHVAGHSTGETKLDWVIVGGESGPGARPCDVTWIRSIKDQCAAADVACFVKQQAFLGMETATDILAAWRESK